MSKLKKRGRPRKIRKPKKMFEHEGVRLVIRKPGPQSETHRWVAVDGNQRIGYYKTPEEAMRAYNENSSGS